MFGYDMCYQLFLSAFDIECHIRLVILIIYIAPDGVLS